MAHQPIGELLLGNACLHLVMQKWFVQQRQAAGYAMDRYSMAAQRGQPRHVAREPVNPITLRQVRLKLSQAIHSLQMTLRDYTALEAIRSHLTVGLPTGQQASNQQFLKLPVSRPFQRS